MTPRRLGCQTVGIASFLFLAGAGREPGGEAGASGAACLRGILAVPAGPWGRLPAAAGGCLRAIGLPPLYCGPGPPAIVRGRANGGRFESAAAAWDAGSPVLRGRPCIDTQHMPWRTSLLPGTQSDSKGVALRERFSTHKLKHFSAQDAHAHNQDHPQMKRVVRAFLQRTPRKQ